MLRKIIGSFKMKSLTTFYKVLRSSFRKKIAGIVVVSVLTVFGVAVSQNFTELTHSFMAKTAVLPSVLSNPDLDAEIYQLDTLTTFNASVNDTTFAASTIDGTGIALGTDLGNTASTADNAFPTLTTLSKLKPSTYTSFGISCKNTGNIDGILSFKMLTEAVDNFTTGDTSYKGSDSTGSYEFNVYESSTLNGTYTKLNPSLLVMNNFHTDTEMTTLSGAPLRVIAPDAQKYYIVIVHFIDGGQPSSNFTGDNALASSVTNVKWTAVFKQN
jgi:hypothetical protein